MITATDRLLVTAWNPHVGRRWAGDLRGHVRGICRRVEPDVFCFNELTCTDDMRRDPPPGYRAIAVFGWGESARNALLVREQLHARLVEFVRIRHSWVGPGTHEHEGWPHPGRTFPVVDVAGWRVVPVHRTRIQWGANAAQAEYDDLLGVGIRATMSDRALVLVGDMNSGINDLSRFTSGQLAQVLGARRVGSGGSVDWAGVVGATGTGREGRLRGSDHSVRHYRFHRHEPRHQPRNVDWQASP